MKYSAVVLSGGVSNRFKRNKSLTNLLDKPMITYVVDSVKSLVDEILITTDTEDKRRKLSKIFDSSIKIILDEYQLKSPVVGALTGLKYARGEYSILLSCDTPLISAKVVQLLLEISKDYDAVIPRWPNGYIEPLQAVYNTEKAYGAAFKAITQKNLKMSDVIKKLRKVLFISTIALSNMDPDLNTFFNVNTPNDFLHAKRILNQLS